MDTQMIINTALLVLTAAAGGLSVYLSGKSKLLAKVAKYIADAEELYKDTVHAGGQKFQWVVDSLYRLIPSPLHLILTRQLIGTLVQNAFDAIQKYAKNQLDKVTDKIEQ